MADDGKTMGGIGGAAEVVLFAPIGPNPAPLSELIWALARQRERRVVEAFVVGDEMARYFFDGEFMAPGAALVQLRDVLGEAILSKDDIHLIEATGADGTALENDDTPELSRAYQALLWEAAGRAIEAAGDRPVVFGLIAGRRRTMTAAQTMIFQLLARPQDLCIDVRVSDSRAEGGSGFFFPEQANPMIQTKGEVLDAREVGVLLVDVQAPRLRGLLSAESLGSFEAAMAAGQAAIDALVPPVIELDAESLKITINGVPSKLSKSEVLWYATLLRARDAAGDGWVAVADTSQLQATMEALNAASFEGSIPSKPIRHLMGEVIPNYQHHEMLTDLTTLRSRTSSKLRSLCDEHFPHHAAQVVPEQTSTQHDGATAHLQRLG